MTVMTAPARGCTSTIHVPETLDVSALHQFWSHLQDAVGTHPARLVIDLSRCSHLDVQAIRLLLDAQQLLSAQDGQLVLADVRPETYRLLSFAGFLGELTLAAAPDRVVSRTLQTTRVPLTSAALGT